MKTVLAIPAIFGLIPATWVSAPASADVPSQARVCSSPARILHFNRGWKLTLPLDDPRRSGRQPREIMPPELGHFRSAPSFVPTRSCAGVRFRAAVNGVTTSGSSYPRAELRELATGGRELAGWSSTSGVHTMTIVQAITHLPNGKRHVVAGQIHDADDDVSVYRLEGSRLYITRGDDSHYKLVTARYRLGTRFRAGFVVSKGLVRAYYNGVLQTTIPARFIGGYFKAGAYTQANCGKSGPCDASNYGEVAIFRLTVTHR